MKFRVYSNVLCDDVSEIIQSIGTDEAIVSGNVFYTVPRSAIRSGAVDRWRAGVLHGNKGTMDAHNVESSYNAGPVPVLTLVNLLGRTTFTVKPLDIVTSHNNGLQIENVRDLAADLGTTVDALADDVRKYTDYETAIYWTRRGVTLRTTESESGRALEKVLRFPFSDRDYEDALVGLQCWADAVHWETINNEEWGD